MQMSVREKKKGKKVEREGKEERKRRGLRRRMGESEQLDRKLLVREKKRLGSEVRVKRERTGEDGHL